MYAIRSYYVEHVPEELAVGREDEEVGVVRGEPRGLPLRGQENGRGGSAGRLLTRGGPCVGGQGPAMDRASLDDGAAHGCHGDDLGGGGGEVHGRGGTGALEGDSYNFV